MTLTGRDRAPYPNTVRSGEFDSPKRVALAALTFVCVWTLYFGITESGSSAHHDALEAYAWGQEFQLGYSKHPPFWAWICGVWFSVFPRANLSFAALSSVNAVAGLLGTWKAAGAVSPERRIDATLLLLLTPFYTFLSFKYNANSIFLSIWPWAIFFFIRAMQTRAFWPTVGLGLAMGAAALSKYYVTVLAGALLIASILHPDRKRYFASASPYVSVCITALVFAPHLVWLIEASAPTLNYLSHASGRNLDLVSTEAALTLVGAIAQNGLMLLFVAFVSRPTAQKVFESCRHPETRFVAALALAPLALTLVAAFLINTKVSTNMTIATFPMLPLFALLLVRTDIDRTRKIVLAAAALLTFAPLVASPLILYVKASRSHAQYDVEPRQELAAAATEFWLKSTGKPLLYVGGSGYYDMGVAFYSVERPHAFLNLDYSRSAWVTPAKLAEGGLLAVCLTADNACRSRAADFVTPESRTTEMTLQHNTVGQVRPAYAFTVTAIPPKAR